VTNAHTNSSAENNQLIHCTSPLVLGPY